MSEFSADRRRELYSVPNRTSLGDPPARLLTLVDALGPTPPLRLLLDRFLDHEPTRQQDGHAARAINRSNALLDLSWEEKVIRMTPTQVLDNRSRRNPIDRSEIPGVRVIQSRFR